MTYKATKVSIVVEKLIQDAVVRIVEEAGATGYTVIEGGGKGRHGLHPSAGRAAVVGAFQIVKIEVVVADRSVAERIAGLVAERHFENHSGIVYLEEVDVLRPGRF